MSDLCNCGKPTRYSRMVDGEERSSCNKHMMCATYEQLRERLQTTMNMMLSYEVVLQKMASVDTYAEEYQYKTWAKEVLKDG